MNRSRDIGCKTFHKSSCFLGGACHQQACIIAADSPCQAIHFHGINQGAENVGIGGKRFQHNQIIDLFNFYEDFLHFFLKLQVIALVHVFNDEGIFGQVDGNYVQLNKSVTSRDYNRTGYTYTRNTGNNGTQYGIVNGEIVTLSYSNWYGWCVASNNSNYYGYRYSRSNSNNSAYNGTLYKTISGTAGNNQSGFEQTSAVSGDELFGSTGSGNNIVYFQLRVDEEYSYSYVDSNGESHPYTGDRYSLVYETTGNMIDYSGTRFTRGNSMNGYPTEMIQEEVFDKGYMLEYVD